MLNRWRHAAAASLAQLLGFRETQVDEPRIRSALLNFMCAKKQLASAPHDSAPSLPQTPGSLAPGQGKRSCWPLGSPHYLKCRLAPASPIPTETQPWERSSAIHLARNQRPTSEMDFITSVVHLALRDQNALNSAQTKHPNCKQPSNHKTCQLVTDPT